MRMTEFGLAIILKNIVNTDLEMVSKHLWSDLVGYTEGVLSFY